MSLTLVHENWRDPSASESETPQHHATEDKWLGLHEEVHMVTRQSGYMTKKCKGKRPRA
jgi:hypothetical protein